MEREIRIGRRSEMLWRIFWLLVTIIVFGGAILVSNNREGVSEEIRIEENGHNPPHQINEPKINIKHA